MNRSRVIVLVAAAFAAGLAALLMRGLLGGGTEKVKAGVPAQIATSEVLVAANSITAGAALTPAAVRWQSWPKSSLDSTFITQDSAPDLNATMKGTVARASMVAGEPLTDAKFVHGDAAGFMAARLTPGMRAISIAISTETGAGGFILPNDRVDILVTSQISDSPRRFATRTLLPDVRVLAVDQTSTQDKDQKIVLGKTATLELTPRQTVLVSRAAASGVLSLSLRGIGESTASATPVSATPVADSKTASTTTQKPVPPADAEDSAQGGSVTVIRYGVSPTGGNRAGE